MEQGNKQTDSAPEDHSGSTAKMTFHELEAITNSIPGGVAQFALDENLTLLYANDGFYRICGYMRADFAGKTGTDILEQLVVWEDMAYILKTVSEQLQCGSEIKLECRITTKKGKIVWIQMNASNSKTERGLDVLQCIFVDITSERLLRQQLQLDQERYQIITEQFNDVFLEYSFETDTIYVSSKWEDLFGYPMSRENVISNILSNEIVYDDDKTVLSKIMDQARAGALKSEFEIRLRKRGAGYIWTNVNTTMICDEIGNPIKIIGKISDIDQQIREREKLISNAQRDQFTKLYNKTTVESYISICLRSTTPDYRHALMIIDVDNFKYVNDTLGHLFGDAVLSGISARLRVMFRSSDIIGRFGGDEFIVFLKNVGGNDKIEEKARAVCDIFRETYTGENRDYKISGSVGISVYPEDGGNFQDLFKKADLALYVAKGHGKDGFVIYNERNHKSH